MLHGTCFHIRLPALPFAKASWFEKTSIPIKCPKQQVIKILWSWNCTTKKCVWVLYILKRVYLLTLQHSSLYILNLRMKISLKYNISCHIPDILYISLNMCWPEVNNLANICPIKMVLFEISRWIHVQVPGGQENTSTERKRRLGELL